MSFTLPKSNITLLSYCFTIEHENEATEDLQHSAVNGNVQVETTGKFWFRVCL